MKELWALWDRYFPRRPGHHNRDFIEARVAYKIQEEAFGGLRPEVRQGLLRIGRIGHPDPPGPVVAVPPIVGLRGRAPPATGPGSFLQGEA